MRGYLNSAEWTAQKSESFFQSVYRGISSHNWYRASWCRSLFPWFKPGRPYSHLQV